MNRKPHPQVAELLSTVFKATPGAGAPSVEQMRTTNDEIFAPLIGPGEVVARVWDEVVSRCGEGVPVRCYQPGEAKPELTILYVHGGGWVTGTIESYDVLCRSLALRANGLVVSIDYDLSPEQRFPRALEQVLAVVRAMSARCTEIGSELTIAGDSAGAQLVGAALHRLAAGNETLPSAAAFIYPVADAKMGNQSWDELGEGFRLTRSVMQWYWEQYIGCSFVELQERAMEPEVSPLQSPLLGSYPRSLVVTAELDPLSGEGAELAARLAAAGTETEHIEVPGQIHGFLRFRRALTDTQWGADAVMTRIAGFLNARQPLQCD
ncbi:alpha/beta hydrolase [Paraburkholderia nemoris]|uniref:Acetyl esterase n=1 Tax=Paraburkholderia nemoris TaxID=2793076 RepID=A0ABN7LM31_9BURK|nr:MULTISPECIES: alpha/beta hydrolase [Paraburkholderia]MBK3812794.1 alpha/beta hydrolase [Paraburkholderia aspalathi]CAE6753683.1 Acetyl esterase [Paraburkholderia nemoris]CAE6807883.1 Acetyl esterase [Paraburkholderia nemoris]